MKTCTLIPHGWPCTLEECPPGHFSWMYSKIDPYPYIGFKSEYSYSNENPSPVCFNEAGEYLSKADSTMVQPLEITWHEE